MSKGKNQSDMQLDNRGWLERLKQAGFTATDREGGRVLVSKYGCGAIIENTAEGPRFAVRPGLLTGNNLAQLLDRGFQKFWQGPEGNFPALARELKVLHSFEQDLRAVMGLTSLYNLSLGTVSSRYIYDRVEGREGPKVHQSFD